MIALDTQTVNPDQVLADGLQIDERRLREMRVKSRQHLQLRNQLEKKPWHRRSTEKADTYFLFLLYAEMKPKRDRALLAKVLSEAYPERATAWKTAITVASARWRWGERVITFDEEQRFENAVFRERVDALEKTHNARVQLDLATTMQDKLLEAARAVDFSSLKPNEMLSVLKVSTELEERARERLRSDSAGAVSEAVMKIAKMLTDCGVEELERLQREIQAAQKRRAAGSSHQPAETG